MDNLTHTLTGVMLARAGLNRLTPRGMLVAVDRGQYPGYRCRQYGRRCRDLLPVSPVDHACHCFRSVDGMRRCADCGSDFPAAASLASSLAGSVGRSGEPSAPGLYESVRHPIVLAVFCRLARLGCHARDRYLDLGDSAPGLLWPMLSGLVSSEIGAKKNPGRGMAITALVLLALIRWWPDPAAPARHRNPPIANL